MKSDGINVLLCHWPWDLGQATCRPCASVSCSLQRPQEALRGGREVCPAEAPRLEAWSGLQKPSPRRGFRGQDLVEEKGLGQQDRRGRGEAGPSGQPEPGLAGPRGAGGCTRAGSSLRPGNREPLAAATEDGQPAGDRDPVGQEPVQLEWQKPPEPQHRTWVAQQGLVWVPGQRTLPSSSAGRARLQA